MFYRDWILTPKPDGAGTPPWLLGPNGQAWLQAVGTSLDDNVDRARQAIKASCPALAPSDALPVLGDEFGTPQGTVEPEDAYRARLVAAWQLWVNAGTAYGILMACYWSGYTNVILQSQNGWQWALNAERSAVVLTAIPGTLHLGGLPAELWNDFAALILPEFPVWWPGLSTVLSGDFAAGVDRLDLHDDPGFLAGDLVRVGSGVNAETVGISEVTDDPSLILVASTTKAHLDGAAVADLTQIIAPANNTEDQRAFGRLLLAWKSAMARCVSLHVINGVSWGAVGGLHWGAFTWGYGTVTVWDPPVT